MNTKKIDIWKEKKKITIIFQTCDRDFFDVERRRERRALPVRDDRVTLSLGTRLRVQGAQWMV
jgi:hypothetical protein